MNRPLRAPMTPNEKLERIRAVIERVLRFRSSATQALPMEAIDEIERILND